MTIKIGVIGAGGIADRRTIPEGILPSAQCELVAVMDSDAGRARAAADKYHVSAYTQSADLLQHPALDAVYIATPNIFHAEQVLAAARAGKHILVEKPIALTVPEGNRMVKACAAAQVTLMLGYMMRFHAHHRQLQEMILRGDLGTPVFGRAQLTCWYPDIPGAWRQDLLMCGGGALLDMGSHCIDLLEMWLGRAVSVSALSRTLTFGYPVEDSATVLLEFESGAQGVVEVNFNVPDESAQNALEIRGTKGVVLADHTLGQGSGGTMAAYLVTGSGAYDAAQERGKWSGVQPVIVEPINPYRAEIEHFVECIETGKKPLTGGAEAIHNLEIILAAYRSAKTGKRVNL